MKKKDRFKYLVCSERNLQWGLVVDTVGKADIPVDYNAYPPQVGHPSDYYFTPREGRILESYQFIYITGGKGKIFTSHDKSFPVEAGDMLIIRPYMWHSYYPDKETGWQEYWIGMHGPDIDLKFENNFFCAEQLIYRIGMRDDLMQLYNQAIDVSFTEHANYQQLLAGIGNLILGMAIYYDRNQSFTNNVMMKRIDQARIIMRENYLTGISPQEVAERVNMGYSWFRKLFKEYTDVSPAHYMLELRLQKARSLLLNSSLSIKEIAYRVGYEDATYFTALFRKHSGLAPLAYRDKFSIDNTGE